MEQAHSPSATDPTLSALGHMSDAALNDIVTYATSLNWGTLCVTLEDEQGRFRVWASNLGALQPADSMKSLDQRLKDAPLMRRSVVSGLERLQVSAKRALAILDKSTPNRSILGGDAQPTTELDELLLSVRSAINHLFGLSMLIRRQRSRGRLPELEELALESSPDISYLTDKFPKAKSNMWLARRLGNKITRQRSLIQYRQRHRESLAKRDVKVSEPADTATIVATTFQEEGSSSGTHQTPQDANSSRMSVFTSATSFVSLEDGTTTGRSIPDLSDMVLDGVQLDYGEPFECPYCRTIQNVGNRHEWKRHVSNDLQPYVCTFKDCVISSKSFTTRAEWFQHECTVHRLQWSCNWCSQPDTTFCTAEELKKHLNNTHPGMVTEAQMPLILETCERPNNSFGSDSCPLCADWEPPSAKENSKSFSRHLARHLQQMALEALPLAIDGLEVRDASHLSDEESSLSYGSDNEEAIRKQPHDHPSPIMQDKDGQDDLDVATEKKKRQEAIAGAPFDREEETTEFRFLPRKYWRGIARDSGLEQVGGEASVTPEEAGFSHIEQDIKGLEIAVTENAARQHLTSFDEQLLRKADQDTVAKIQEEKKSVQSTAAAEGKKSAAEEPKEGIEETKARLKESKNEAPKAHVRFKDAVGRKFSFPFYLCNTWQGMEDLIKQAFMQVDVLGPHVMEGHYDLVGPDGEIILPSVWEKVIQPDWAITMVMWPMDGMPSLPTQRAFPPHGRGGAFQPPPPPGFRPPTAEWHRTPDVVTVGPSPGKKHARRSGKETGSGMAGFLFGKPDKKKKVVSSSSADQQSSMATFLFGNRDIDKKAAPSSPTHQQIQE